MKWPLLLLIFPTISFANFDALLGFNARSYPGVGGAGYLKAGYNIPLMGSISKDSPFYSMLRFQTELNSSTVVYHHDTQVLFYPLGFFAIGAGRKEMTSEYENFAFYDCEVVRCVGTLNKDYTLAKAAFGFSGLILSLEYRISRIHYSDEDEEQKAPGEYEYTITTQAGDEVSHKRTYFMGLKLDGDMLGLYANYIDFHFSNKYFSEHYLIYRYNFSPWDLIVGGGNLYSSDQKPSQTAIIQLNYRFSMNNAMF